MIYRPRLASHERFRPFHTAIFTTAIVLLTFVLLQALVGANKTAFYQMYLDCMATRWRTHEDAWAMQADMNICLDVMVYHYSRFGGVISPATGSQ